MDRPRRRAVYEGKSKILYEGPSPGTLVQHFKDDATAGNAEKKEIIDGKGALNNRISEFMFTRLGEIGIPTHFIKRLNMREQLVREVEIIPLEAIVRNVAAGTLAKRLGLEEGTRLPRAIVEFCYKSDALGDPLVSEEHVAAFDWASQQDLDDITQLSLRVNDYLSGLFRAVNVTLVDFKLEFGRLYEGEEMRIVLADEISPDSCRLWDATSLEKMDKDRFRLDMGGVLDGYREVARRLGIISDSARGKGPILVADNTETSGSPPAKFSRRKKPFLDLRRRPRVGVAERGASSMTDYAVSVAVRVKASVSDPQGETIKAALSGSAIGVEALPVVDARQGKLFDLVIRAESEAQAREVAERASRRLLANPTLETFEIVEATARPSEGST